MSKKNLSLLKGSFTVLILAALVYITLFFFFPNTAMKYFGTAFNKEKAIENSIVSLVYNAEYLSTEEKAAFESYLSTMEGKVMLKGLSEAAAKGADSAQAFVESDSFQNLSSSVKSSLSPEKLEKLWSDCASSADALFSRFSK